TLIKNDKIGTYCFSEIGAFGVGSIINTTSSGAVRKMQEKGYFKFGGSTVVVVFQPGQVTFSPDLVENSAKGLETLVKVGQPLATATL
ncbi:phosphatidylserine decarboxylase, partial [Pseudophaeobacter sp.]